MSELKRLMAIISDVHERPEARDEFRVELLKLHEKDRPSYEETMKDLEELSPKLFGEMKDFIGNINNVRKFLEKIES